MTTPKYVEDILKSFEEKEWKHWHSKSSSFERLPNSTKNEIKSFITSSFKAFLESEIARMEGEIDRWQKLGEGVNMYERRGAKAALSHQIEHYKKLRDKIT